MTREEKDLVLRDLCARLPYGVMVKAIGWDVEKNQDVEVAVRVYSVNTDGHVEFGINDYDIEEYLVDDCKPYLRPMSSMTEEEKEEYGKVCELDTEILANHPMNGEPFPALYNSQDWLNKHHFDYRGLIPKDCAIAVTEDNNPYKD